MIMQNTAFAREKMFSINGAADLLAADRRTLRRALADVSADAEERGQPCWPLSTIVAASLVHNRRTMGNRHSADRDHQADAIEAVAQELAVGLEELRGEPDLGERHCRAEQVGPPGWQTGQSNG
jgi:hypothetical protein